MSHGITKLYVHNYMSLVFEYYVTTARRDRYNLMCSIETHEKNHKCVYDEASSDGGRPLSSNSTKYDFILFGITPNFIDI